MSGKNLVKFDSVTAEFNVRICMASVYNFTTVSSAMFARGWAVRNSGDQ